MKPISFDILNISFESLKKFENLNEENDENKNVEQKKNQIDIKDKSKSSVIEKSSLKSNEISQTKIQSTQTNQFTVSNDFAIPKKNSINNITSNTSNLNFGLNNPFIKSDVSSFDQISNLNDDNSLKSSHPNTKSSTSETEDNDFPIEEETEIVNKSNYHENEYEEIVSISTTTEEKEEENENKEEEPENTNLNIQQPIQNSINFNIEQEIVKPKTQKQQNFNSFFKFGSDSTSVSQPTSTAATPNIQEQPISTIPDSQKYPNESIQIDPKGITPKSQNTTSLPSIQTAPSNTINNTVNNNQPNQQQIQFNNFLQKTNNQPIQNNQNNQIIQPTQNVQNYFTNPQNTTSNQTNAFENLAQNIQSNPFQYNFNTVSNNNNNNNFNPNNNFGNQFSSLSSFNTGTNVVQNNWGVQSNGMKQQQYQNRLNALSGHKGSPFG